MTIKRTRRAAGRLDRLRRHASGAPKTAQAVALARQQARRAEQRLRDAIDALPEGVVYLDPEGRYVLWNRKYAEIYHRSADLFQEGARLADTLRVGVARGDYPEAVGREEAWLAERLALLDTPGQRHEQQLADGRWILIEERKTGDGGVIGLRIDITEMKAQAQRLEAALAQARAASRAKSDFLANISHEIRTPLNGVIGLADVLSRTRLDDEQRDLLRTIMASADDLNVLLGDMLDLARLEAGKVEITPVSFRITDLVQDCAALFRARAEEKGLQLTVEATPDADGQVLGDVTRMKQILNNLLSNAVKFTTHGSVSLRVSRDAASAHRFEVADTGVGFDDIDAERLFGRFEQADGSTTRRFGGTGLGLAICRQLAGLMGGTMSASGRKGEGAAFCLVIPLPSAGASGDTKPAGESPVAGRTLRVLLADDNAVNCKIVDLMLSAIGAEVTCVSDGAMALDAFAAQSFDVVLMDLQMPVMDGLTATRRIRARERQSGARPTPIVVLSANVYPADRAASLEAGACDHIGKPVRSDELIGAILRAVEQGERTAAA